MKKYIFILIIVILMFVINIKYEANTYTYILNPKYMYNIDNFNKIKKENEVLDKFTGTITGYGPDCYGCIGITSSGYDVRNTIYYNDKTYDKVRVLAADKSLPFGTIIKVSNLKDYNDFIGIVLDRGSAISFTGASQIDLLFKNEISSYDFGRKHNVTFEILRLGY